MEKIQILKLTSANENFWGVKVAPDKDIEFIAEFNDFEEIAEKYGSQDAWAGLELANGKVVFNQTLYNNYLDSKKPLAMGKDLVQFLNAYRSGIGPDKVKALLTKLAITYLLLGNSDFNPFTEKTFAFILADLDTTLNGDALLVKQICLGWAKDKKFAKK